MKRAIKLSKSEAIMVESSRTWTLRIYLILMAYPMISPALERKNRTLQEMARTMIQETDMARHLWAEAVNTACYIQNKISIRPILNNTPYELLKNKKPNISYFHPFGCTCFVLNTKDYLGKFDSKAQKCILLGYSERSKGYRIYNKDSQIVE